MAAWAPVTDVASWRETTGHGGIPAGGDAACGDGALAGRSPLRHADRIARAPVSLVRRDADTRVPTAQSLLPRDALLEAGGTRGLGVLAGVAHGRGRDGTADGGRRNGRLRTPVGTPGAPSGGDEEGQADAEEPEKALDERAEDAEDQRQDDDQHHEPRGVSFRCVRR